MAEEAARRLSSQIWPLGEQVFEIWNDLDEAGYGEVSAIVREGHYAMAGTPEVQAQLKDYWREAAKEGLAGLVHMWINRAPSRICAYQSQLLASLRARAHTLPVGPVKSPQIEPTIKRYLENHPHEFGQRVHEKTRAARKRLGAPGDADNPQFGKHMGDVARYAALGERYSRTLIPRGFLLDPYPEQGLVFRKPTTDKNWQFILEDFCPRSRFTLYPVFALVSPDAAVIPGHLGRTASAWIDCELLVPGFFYSQGFDGNSYGEFALAADSVAFLCNNVFDRIDRLLSNS
jgi:hypothetical protein